MIIILDAVVMAEICRALLSMWEGHRVYISFPFKGDSLKVAQIRTVVVVTLIMLTRLLQREEALWED